MTFKRYLQESVIVPNRIKINTSDIKKLNKQFKNNPIDFNFKYADEGEDESAAFFPSMNKISVTIKPETPLHVIETLIQHEIIHSIQDLKSGNRMQADIEKSAQLLNQIVNDVEEWEDDDEYASVAIAHLAKEYQKLQTKAKFLNDEERMTYAYMFVKLRGSDNIKSVIKEANEMWTAMTNEKMSNKMLKYFYSYWMVKDQL